MRGQRLREMGNELSFVLCVHSPRVVSELLAGRCGGSCFLTHILVFSEWLEYTLGHFPSIGRNPGFLPMGCCWFLLMP